ncbi:MAG: TetR/AcrR family transcriptional regulator [Gammaproteobacteria bacterium]
MPGSKTFATRSSYHHGDLRCTLVEAAEHLLEKQGLASLSLREVAKLAGVSHSAPYRHFRGKAGLLEAVAEAGFRRLADLVNDARESNPEDPVAQLRAAGVAYVAWATQNPERTHLMFGGMMKSADTPQGLHDCAEHAYSGIYRIIDDGRRTAVFGGEDTDSVVISAWSAVHGLTMLVLGSGKLNPEGPDEVRRLATTICETILTGIRSRT